MEEKPVRDFFNADEIDSEENRKEAERLRLRDISDLKKVLSLPEGRRYIWRVFGRCNTFRNPAVPKDNNATYINIGKADIGLSILEDIQNVGTEAYSQIRNEWLSEKMSKKKENE
jgi:hypothetical protein